MELHILVLGEGQLGHLKIIGLDHVEIPEVQESALNKLFCIVILVIGRSLEIMGQFPKDGNFRHHRDFYSLVIYDILLVNRFRIKMSKKI